jgi:hypothetical protein
MIVISFFLCQIDKVEQYVDFDKLEACESININWY